MPVLPATGRSICALLAGAPSDDVLHHARELVGLLGREHPLEARLGVLELHRPAFRVRDAGDEDGLETLPERGEDAVGRGQLERRNLHRPERQRQVARERLREREAAPRKSRV